VASVVLDASALLVLLHAERGFEAVAATLPGAAVSTVNLSEVVGKLAERGMPPKLIRAALLGLGLEIHPFDAEMAFVAGELRPKTRARGLSLGDRACLTLGIFLSRPVVTADRSWRNLGVGVKVTVVR